MAKPEQHDDRHGPDATTRGAGERTEHGTGRAPGAASPLGAATTSPDGGRAPQHETAPRSWRDGSHNEVQR